MTFHIKVCSSITYNVLLVEFGEPPIGLYPCKLNMGFQQQLAHLPSCWLVSKTTSLSKHLAKQGFQNLTQINNHMEGIMGSISLGNP